MPGLLLSLNTSPLHELTTIDGRRVPSGIFKRAVSGPRKVELAGIDGDAQADATVHGGPAKAVYAYPSEHYPFWSTLRAQFGVAAWGDGVPFGALGENLTLAGLLEIDVWVGDVLRFPNCTLGVSGPRLPCFKLDAALGFGHASDAMTARAWCGFYLAVHVPARSAPASRSSWSRGRAPSALPNYFARAAEVDRGGIRAFAHFARCSRFRTRATKTNLRGVVRQPPPCDDARPATVPRRQQRGLTQRSGAP